MFPRRIFAGRIFPTRIFPQSQGVEPAEYAGPTAFRVTVSGSAAFRVTVSRQGPTVKETAPK